MGGIYHTSRNLTSRHRGRRHIVQLQPLVYILECVRIRVSCSSVVFECRVRVSCSSVVFENICISVRTYIHPHLNILVYAQINSLDYTFDYAHTRICAHSNTLEYIPPNVNKYIRSNIHI
jgi:hypothetical protein